MDEPTSGQGPEPDEPTSASAPGPDEPVSGESGGDDATSGESEQDGDDTGGAGRSWLVRGLLVVLVLGLAGVAAWWWTSRPEVTDPGLAAEDMAAAWASDGLVAVDWATEPEGDGQAQRAIPPPPTQQALDTMLGDLGPEGDGVESTTVQVDDVTVSESDPHTATAELTVTWQLPRDRTWQQVVTATLVRHPDELTWAPLWSPKLIHPDVRADDVLDLRVTRAERGVIRDRNGNVLVGPQRVTEVGLHPARIEDLDGVVDAIVNVVDRRLDIQLDRGDILDDVDRADPDHFVPVITLRNPDYQRIEDVVYPLIGTTFRDGVEYLAPTADFAPFTLGSVGEVTAEQLEEQPERWERGDVAGRSGLQEAQDEVLAGTNGWSIVATRDGDNDPTLHEVEPTPGQDVQVGIQPRLQRAAQGVIADVGSATSLVVVRPSTGEVVAMANSPEATFDIARTGQVAPGSVFKVVSTAALVANGMTADTRVGCPSSVTINGRSISNANGFALGQVPFSRAFAQSCNTTFVAQSRDLPPDAFQQAAEVFGIGADWQVGLPVSSGSVPVAEGAFDKAQLAFGQGRNQVNPLVMATVMASVAAGERIEPRLVTGHGGEEVEPAAREPLPDGLAPLLQDLTRQVVTDGSGTALADVPGPPVHGKTGTADFVGEDGAGLHVWFAGWQGDLAFAVVVTDIDSGSGGGTAAPLVADFLTRIRG